MIINDQKADARSRAGSQKGDRRTGVDPRRLSPVGGSDVKLFFLFLRRQRREDAPEKNLRGRGQGFTTAGLKI